ncbi:MAG TPA: nucleotide-diphospho-sugar transferase [Flavobacterium sp.]|uniref:nucleotide-diphospho-sugar transferase n=1 Tax=Flavobacterium sp. TaxID=239 RepID=UPI002C079AF8|nr:nucleotide-diphospho-sugar transferase [Flavobacterium sp.]HNP33568.1 nucleotide-diphospho-sugar transferase [Flavobacterium sp.]
MYSTPILFLVFNRPEETSLSLEAIRKIKPKYLYIAADGPRPENRNDEVNCKKVRDIILQGIDWDCEVKTLFREENLGCGTAVQGALDWFFNQVEMGIIVEDDIVPAPAFFDYCTILLDKYKDDSRIFTINGNNLTYENPKYDYGLTGYFNMWGWATWRRSNELVNKTWPEFNLQNDFKKGSQLLKKIKLPTIFPQDEWYYRWELIFDKTKNGTIDTWDYQWVYTCLKNQKYCIRPNFSMVENIGFNENSTHTSQAPHAVFINQKSKVQKLKTSDLKGRMNIESEYEIKHVAEYWNNVIIDYNTLIKKVKVYFRKFGL